MPNNGKKNAAKQVTPNTSGKNTIPEVSDELFQPPASGSGMQLLHKDVKKEIKKEVKKGVKKVEREIKEHLDKERVSLIAIFGIFAAIVTFLSVELQILQAVCDFWKLLGLSGFLLSALLLFLLLLISIGQPKNNSINKIFLAVGLVFFFSILALSNSSTDEFTCKKVHLNAELDKKYAELELGKEVENELNEEFDMQMETFKKEILEYVEEQKK